MPFPAGMLTREVAFAPFFDTGGLPVKGTIRVTAERAFIWSATGETFLTEPVPVETNGIEVTVELPVPGQAGFVDGAGNTISDWSYTAHYSLSKGMYTEPVTFLLPSGASPLAVIPNVSAQVTAGIVNTPYPVQGDPGDPGAPGAGVAAGGTTGQALVKLSAADYDTGWADAAGTPPDATTTTKGIVQLAGDLAGTATAPTVPGLAGKAATVHTHAQADVTNLVTDLAAKAPLASPGLTGTPTAPTAATATNTTQIATTAFVKAQGYATLASPALTGNPTAPTPAVNDNDTSIATTAFVTAADTALGATKANVSHTHAQADVTNLVTDLAGKAASVHTHAAADVTSGVFPIARLATGTPDGTKFIRDDGVLATPAGGGGGVATPYQHVPPVGGTVTSVFFTSSTTATLRDRSTTPMPLVFAQNISIDQAAFNLTVLAVASGQTVSMDLMQLDQSTGSWTLVSNLATGIPVASPATIGEIVASFTAIPLTAGVIYGIRVYEDQAFDGTLRVTQGVMVGPGIGKSSGYGAGYNLPIGANTSTTTAVPVVRVRRSA